MYSRVATEVFPLPTGAYVVGRVRTTDGRQPTNTCFLLITTLIGIFASGLSSALVLTEGFDEYARTIVPPPPSPATPPQPPSPPHPPSTPPSPPHLPSPPSPPPAPPIPPPPPTNPPTPPSPPPPPPGIPPVQAPDNSHLIHTLHGDPSSPPPPPLPASPPSLPASPPLPAIPPMATTCVDPLCVCQNSLDQAQCAGVAAAQYAVLTYIIDDPAVPQGCFEDRRSGSLVYVFHSGSSGFVFSTTGISGMQPICFD